MGITTVGLSVIAANMTGSALPTHIAIGISGVAYASGNTALGSETDRNQLEPPDLGTPEQVTMIATWGALEISGTVLKEYGTFTGIGSQMLNREVMAGSLVFDGEQELQIQQTFQINI